jgi:hypothetical protein
MNNNKGQVCCQNRKNKHSLIPSSTPITYSNNEISTHFSLPRVYTSTHNDEKREVYIHVGTELNRKMLSEPEPVNVESQVVGKWYRVKGKYEIRLRVLVSTLKNPQAAIRNKIFCESMSMVLEAIALAERGMLIDNPKKKKAKIYIKFVSHLKEYNRTEKWGRLGEWL